MERSRRAVAVALSLALAVGLAGTGRCSPAADDTIHVSFRKSLVNLEFDTGRLAPAPPEGLIRIPEGATNLWFGTVLRGQAPSESGKMRDALFAAELRNGVVVHVWFDSDRDGDLTDDPPVELYAYPGAGPNGRSAIVDLHWVMAQPGATIPVDWKIRIVLAGAANGFDPPTYRLQMVYGMEGTIRLEGVPHRAVLYDGSFDGLYTKSFADGMFVDVNDDAHLDINLMSPEFAPFTVPFPMGRHRYEVDHVDPRGNEVTLRDLGTIAPVGVPETGMAAPEFSITSTDGRTVHLSDYRGRWVFVYFFASWCATCGYQGPQLSGLYERYHAKGLEIVGISYDSNADSLQSFRTRNGELWAVSFTGKSFWENPVGQLYRAGGAGEGFLVNPGGRIDGKYTDIPQLEERLRVMTRRDARVNG